MSGVVVLNALAMAYRLVPCGGCLVRYTLTAVAGFATGWWLVNRMFGW